MNNLAKQLAQEMSLKEIVVTPKDVYGKLTYYPNCDDSRTFANLAGTKTLTADALRYIGELGYRIKLSAQAVPAGWSIV